MNSYPQRTNLKKGGFLQFDGLLAGEKYKMSNITRFFRFSEVNFSNNKVVYIFFGWNSGICELNMPGVFQYYI